MVRYELKKMLARTGSRVAFGILGVVLLIAGYFSMMNITYVNEQGAEENGPAAIHKLKEEVREWEGSLTEERIAEVLEKDRKIRQAKEQQSADLQQDNMTLGKMQGYQEILMLMLSSYSGFQEYNYPLDTLTADDTKRFYKNREDQLKIWLDTKAKEKYSESEKEFLLEQYGKLKTPLYYEFSEGWTSFFSNVHTVQTMIVLVLGFLLSGLFAREVQLRADAVFFTSYYGRTKAVKAKLLAGVLLTTVVYWSVMLLYSLLILGIIGLDGAFCMIQTSMVEWNTFYNITMIQKYLLILFGGYIGTMFFEGLTMLISAKTKSAVLAVMTPFVLGFLPGYLTMINIPMISKIVGVLPNRLLQFSMALRSFELYSVGGQIMGSVPILLVGYGVLTPFLYPMVYRVFRRIEVK